LRYELIKPQSGLRKPLATQTFGIIKNKHCVKFQLEKTNLMAQGYCDKDCKRVTDGQSRGIQFQCGICGKYTSKEKQGNPDISTNEKWTDNGYTAEYTVTSEKRVTTVDEVIELCKIDTKIWKVDKFEVGTHEGYRKDRSGWWKSENGKVSGESNDSGKILVVPLHSVRVWLSRKTEEIRSNILVNEFSVRAVKLAPNYQKIKYEKVNVPHLFELGLPDLQLGRLVDVEETGRAITPEMQVAMANSVVDKLISYTNMFEVNRILFPVGNDFFDTNSADMFTKHGTPQQDDVRWKRVYSLGCDFLVKTIEKLMQVAPVDVLVIPGNHDEDKMWYAGEYLDAWFKKSKDVSVDNRAMKRKYYAFGQNLIGLTHGYFEKNNKLDSLMAYEVPQLWANSLHREWHLGDKHHKVDMVLKTNELENGVVVRILRSLASPSVWEYDKGFVGSLKSAEAFVWHEFDGIVAQFTAS
jgi:hypothetical protein